MLVILGVVIILMKAQRIKINVSKTRKFVINRKCFQLCSRISNQFGWMAMLNVKLSSWNMQLSSGRNFQDNTLPNLCLLNRNFLRNKANNSQRWGFQREKQKTKQIEREREWENNALSRLSVTLSVRVMCDGIGVEKSSILRVRYMPIWDLLLS